MWNVAAAVVILSLSRIVFGASVFHCPEGSTCYEEGAIETSSFQFLDKLGPKQYQTIIKLTVSNALLDKVPAKLKYLRKLEYLDLSDNSIQISSIPSLPSLKTLKICRNQIKDISLIWLPNNIEELDLSNNLLTRLPRDWKFLKSLKTIHLHKNFIDCDCHGNNINIYRSIVEHGVNIPEPIFCHEPKQFSGKFINSINCSEGDIMINDQPEEGSGSSEDIFAHQMTPGVPHLLEEDKVEENEVIDDKDEFPQEQPFVVADDVAALVAPEEGSGDFEGSGFAPIEIEHVPACIYNCATPGPIGIHDNANDTGTAPGPKDQMKMFAEDVIYPLIDDAAPSSSTTTTTTEAATTSPLQEVNEEIIKASQAPVSRGKEYEVDVFANETHTGEMEKATAINQNNFAVYVVVVCGSLIAVVLFVYLIKKRKAKRLNKNRRELPTGYGEEMKPLEKPSIQQVNEKNGKYPNNIPEHIPLMNGQNGKHKDEPVLKSYIPLTHPELKEQGTKSEEPIIREKSALLTPHTERVTIRASEIPESIPKTPVLVHRQKNSEGEIVTTVVPP